MAGKLKLTVACGDYEIVRALKEGAVQADGIELVMLTGMGSKERHWRMARKAEFDVCEVNVGGYFMSRDRGEALAAIPVYLHRRFRHGFAFVNAASGIREPKDLVGKKIGGTNFQPASNIWMRGILEQYYGVPHRQCTWVVERSEDVEFTPAKDLRIERIPEGKRLDVMLAEGEIPAMLSPDLPRLFLEGDKRIVRLFANYKDVEIEFFRKTAIFPIMHVTVVKQEIIDKYPWVATNLVKAFEDAKALAYRHVANPRTTPLAWVRTAWEEQQDVLGPDPWAYGLGDTNRKNLETVQIGRASCRERVSVPV
jgi:4,5-dihydroxyphthalate decarboxylase